MAIDQSPWVLIKLTHPSELEVSQSDFLQAYQVADCCMFKMWMIMH